LLGSSSLGFTSSLLCNRCPWLDTCVRGLPCAQSDFRALSPPPPRGAGGAAAARRATQHHRGHSDTSGKRFRESSRVLVALQSACLLPACALAIVLIWPAPPASFLTPPVFGQPASCARERPCQAGASQPSPPPVFVWESLKGGQLLVLSPLLRRTPVPLESFHHRRRLQDLRPGSRPDLACSRLLSSLHRRTAAS